MIASVIQQLAEDNSLRTKLAAGAATHARDLSWERCAAETYRLPRPTRSGDIQDPPVQAISA
jgi:hypothetical protein